MTTTPVHTEAGRRDLLQGLGLNPDAPGLVDVAPTEPAKKKKAAKHVEQVVESLDPRKIPAGEIVFDPAMLDDFPDLNGAGMAAASRMLFDHYKSPHKDRERHALLHRRIGEFIQQTRRARQQMTEPTGTVKEKVKATKEQRDLAAMIAEAGLTADDLSRLLKERS